MHWAHLEASALGSLVAACPAWKRREEKLEGLGYPMVKKPRRYVKPFSSDTGTLRMDGQTDGWTDRNPISISRVSMLMRGKNRTQAFEWYQFE